mgnify:CR=1 FL=1
MTADRRTGLVLFASCLAQFMVVLDVSIVNVALPSMRTALGFDAEGLAWVVNAYTLAFAGFLLLGGRAADLFVAILNDESFWARGFQKAFRDVG